ncbi:uncharacterized protein LOC143250674 [Tachypleus tridentatus]|uniref:uncharacterized protein LOC143250674 n=1 Tax=Tachypleus tridentatus TaxID=6853 RepID=UPI003FCFF6E6
MLLCSGTSLILLGILSLGLCCERDKRAAYGSSGFQQSTSSGAGYGSVFSVIGSQGEGRDNGVIPSTFQNAGSTKNHFDLSNSHENGPYVRNNGAGRSGGYGTDISTGGNGGFDTGNNGGRNGGYETQIRTGANEGYETQISDGFNGGNRNGNNAGVKVGYGTGNDATENDGFGYGNGARVNNIYGNGNNAGVKGGYRNGNGAIGNGGFGSGNGARINNGYGNGNDAVVRGGYGNNYRVGRNSYGAGDFGGNGGSIFKDGQSKFGGYEEKQIGDEEDLGLAAFGEPGVDFPVFAEVPETEFQCSAQEHPGYYADPETKCQVFHICQDDGRSDSFLCPNATLFNQQYFVCDWWYNVDCSNAESFYNLNAELFKSEI